MIVEMNLAHYRSICEPVQICLEAREPGIPKNAISEARPGKVLRSFLLHGPSGSGKSSIAHACLHLKRIVTEGKAYLHHVRPESVRCDYGDAPTQIRMEIRVGSKTVVYAIELNGNRIL